LQPAEVARLLDDPARLVLTVRSADRFGDNGLVGALFCRRDGDVLHIDNFVLSCRVFSRGIEQASLSVLLRHARASGAAGVTAAYRASPKNAIVRGLYPRHGFAVVADGEDSAAFRHDLADVVPPPEHIRLDVPPGLGAPSEGDLP
jgi:FkbH-like protein